MRKSLSPLAPRKRKTFNGLVPSASVCRLFFMLCVLSASLSSRCQCPLTGKGDASQPTPTLNVALATETNITGGVMGADGKPAQGTVTVCLGNASIGNDIPINTSGQFSAPVKTALKAKQMITAQFVSTDKKSSPVATLVVAGPPKPLCSTGYNDCRWSYQLVGGVEQSDLSAQDSQTEGFIDLFTRGPLDTRTYSWLEARFLGAPNNSNTQGIASAVTNPSGTVTASTLSTVGEAVDYVIGVGTRVHTADTGRWSLDGIAGFGATTPLSSESASVAYAVPAYGTNECNLLQNRFTASAGYNNPLPTSGTITTSVITNGGTPVVTTSPQYCVVQPGSVTTTSTSSGTTTTTTTSGTQITDIAFAPENRTSFLLKYVFGLRYMFRTSTTGDENCAGTNDSLTDTCARTMVDFTIGQDEEITGGKLRRLVYKANAVFPIPKATAVYFFASASIRGKRNQEFAPLLLTQVPISTATGTPVTGSVTVPSPSVFVLPLLQSDRDFYRIGIALDLSKLLPNLFK